MFRIRRIFDDALPLDRAEIAQVQAMLRERFPGAPTRDADELPERLKNPLKYRFRTLLYVADDFHGRVQGFALVFHERTLGFLYLDFLASGPARKGAGIGGALYERVREEGHALGVRGVFFECLPDDRAECETEELYRENVARLRFYERYGARPIIGAEYELPLKEGDRGLPHLVFDDLDSGKPLRRDAVRPIVQAILERRYGRLCPREYVERVVASFRDDPVALRPPRYLRKPSAPRRTASQRSPSILLVVNARHDIHHVRDRGYVETPVRVRAILKELEPSGLFRETKPRHYSEEHILAVHDRGYFEYFKRMCRKLPEGKSVYPYVFPLRNQARPPKEMAVRAGYYCIDTFTPLSQNALRAALRGVDCSLTCAEAVLRGERLAYALVRPPGHHAEHAAFGGFCYFNNAAVAAHFLSRHGHVAILDIDYHHGNGQQQIFWERPDVLTVSIHGNPRFAYPYFSGFEDETGGKAGEGFNVNFSLPETVDGARYATVLEAALRRVRSFDPAFLVVALGLDTAKGDPTGTWSLRPADLEANGHRIGVLGKPTVVIQEGGYRTRTLGTNALAFFTGLEEGMRQSDLRGNGRHSGRGNASQAGKTSASGRAKP